ncbi:MAG: hypothetical protein LBC76_02205 [Treponema sp.]|jgi:hypothetical protein|nr:hypothetical protein [Treponema sp.]
MKNVLKVFGIIALVAVIGFSFASCSSGGGGGGSNNNNNNNNNSGNGTYTLTREGSAESNPFVGIWNGKADGYSIKLDIKADLTWTFTHQLSQNNNSGTYTYTGNNATFTSNVDTRWGTATVSGNTLTITATGL